MKPQHTRHAPRNAPGLPKTKSRKPAAPCNSEETHIMTGTKRTLATTTATTAALGLALGAGAALASPQTIELTIASSHPTTIAWVGGMPDHFQPEVNRCLAENGDEYTISWREAFGGQLYRANATLNSIGDGITDLGWVFIGMETSALPLMQLGAVTPFVSDDLPTMMQAVNAAHDEVEALRQQWEDNNVVFLGASGNDTYDLFLRAPITSVAELQGLRLTAPQSLSLWLMNSGAALREGGLTSYYTDIQTGLAEGTISMATGILPVNVYEVAPYIVQTNIGAIWNGALAINMDVYEGLPEVVQQCMHVGGRHYSVAHAEDVMTRAQTATEEMLERGASQNPPVQLVAFPEEEREIWAAMLPNIAGDWVERNGPAAAEVLNAYMNAMREAGATPLRDWDLETAAGQ